MGTTSEKLVYLNETKQKIKESINLTNANITNEPFRQYAVILKNRLPEIVGDPSIIWNNYEHVTGSGTSITISTYKSIFEYSLNGDTTQSGTPTPDAPIPVNTVTGNQTITISNGTDSTVQYINLGTTNMFNINGSTSGGTLIKYNNGFQLIKSTNRTIRFLLGKSYPAGTYSINYDIIENTVSTNSNFAITLQYTDNATVTSNIAILNDKTFTATGTFDRLYFFINNAESDSATITLDNIMLSSTNAPQPYFPYGNTPIELCKIGTYQDRIYKSNGKWYLHKEIGKYTFTGDENWTVNTNSSYSYYMFSLGTMLNYFPNYARIGGNTTKSNKYKGANNVAGSAPVFSQGNYLCCFRYNTGDSIDAFYITSNISTPTAFKTEVKDTIVYYVLANSTTEEIKNYDLLNDLNSLELMTGNITITVSGDLASPIDITAIKN